MMSLSLQSLLPLLLLTSSSYGFSPRSSVLSSSSSSRTSSLNADANGTNENKLMPLREGSTVALITPMKENGDVDVPGLRNLLQLHLDSGTDNLCILGTTGEASVLTMEEREVVLQNSVEMCKGKIPMMIGTGTINPVSVKAMTQQALDLGCDASLLVTPYYVKPPQRALVDHFVTAADHYGLPVVMYNVPGRTGVNFEDENIVRCAQHDNIVALKDATGDMNRLSNMLKLLRRDSLRNKLLLFSGDDGTTTEFCTRGGDGCISVTANIAPKQMVDMVRSAIAGTITANFKNSPLVRLHQEIFCEANPIPAKWCAKRLGLIESDFTRPPLCTMDPKFEPKLEQILREAGLLFTENDHIITQQTELLVNGNKKEEPAVKA